MDDTEAQFVAITGCSPQKAEQYLRLTDYNLEQAVALYFDSGGIDLEGQETSSASAATSATSRPPAPPSLRPQRTVGSYGYADEDGVVHLDSDDDMDDDDSPEVTGWNQTGQQQGDASLGHRTPRNATPPPVREASEGQGVESDEALARRLQEELYAGGDVDGAVDVDGVRAPIARTRETLVGPGTDWGPSDSGTREAVMAQMRARQAGGSSRGTIFIIFSSSDKPAYFLIAPGIFNQRPTSTLWDDESDPSSRRTNLSRTTGGASESSSKASLLAEMYRPPFELICRLPWDLARQEGRDKEKWMIVNVQDPSVFDCQILNRDIWKDSQIKETVRENFILMQYNNDDPRGREYIQYYFQSHGNQDTYPHIAIVDPRTGEQVKVWSGPPVPKPMEFLMQLHEFLDRYSLKANAKNPVAVRKPAKSKAVDVDRMTEEEMLQMALQNSMTNSGFPSGSQDDDPDALTRTTGSIGKGKGRALEDEPQKHDDENLMEMEPADTNGHVSNASPFMQIVSNNPHTEPPANPATTTRIQFRHSGGRVIRRFALSDPVMRIYEWLKAEPLEGKAGAEFELVCMGKNLIEVLNRSIEQAGLKNQTVMVEFLED
ncbi:hypothetical protein GP486_001042 [Trichoglossum hirsutum]|uniref:UBX domain-containing protein n=1 Tax=Trichoglossum hirsutum TaxID=265104 RepID=A0A9P8RTE6_9PEZI|nr:hypothetical protein GP486_001042 [Trichoglossum hirsutum]